MLLHSLLGFSIPCVILVVGVSTMIYSMLGGLQAVVWTDAIQAILLIGGALVCLIVLGCTLPDGLGAGLGMAFDSGKFSLGSFSMGEWRTETFWVTLIYGVFLNLQNFGIDQSYTQRYVAAKNEKEAVKSMFFGAMLLGLFLLGAFARRTRKAQAAVATLVGLLVVLWITFGQNLTCGHAILHLNLAMVFGTTALVFVGFLCSCAKRDGSTSMRGGLS